MYSFKPIFDLGTATSILAGYHGNFIILIAAEPIYMIARSVCENLTQNEYVMACTSMDSESYHVQPLTKLIFNLLTKPIFNLLKLSVIGITYVLTSAQLLI